MEKNGSPAKDRHQLDLESSESIKRLTGLLPTEFHQRLAKLDWRDRTLEDSKATVNACLPGIMLAGAVFPTVVAACCLTFFFISGTINIGFFVGMMALCVLVGSFVGFIVAGVGTIAAWMIIPACNSLLGFPLDARRLVAVTGGFAGYACTVLPVLFEDDIDLVPLPYYCVVGTAALMGQIGAIWYASKPESWVDTLHSNEIGQLGRSQFGLKQIFIVTAVVAVLLGIDRGIEFRLGFAVLVFVSWQTVTLGLDAVWRSLGKFRSREPNGAESN